MRVERWLYFERVISTSNHFLYNLPRGASPRRDRFLFPSFGDHQQLVLPEDDAVTGVQLAAAPYLGLAVDERGLAGEQCFDLAAAVDHAGELEQLSEANAVSADGYFVGHD